LVQPTGSAVVNGVLSKVTANNNGIIGIFVNGASTTGASLNVTISDSEASNNGSIGVEAVSNPGQTTAAVMVRDVVISNNNIGLGAGGNSTIWAAHSVVTGNGTGVSAGGTGVLNSYVDNDINGNTNDNTGVLTALAMH
jgi:hypothetical protein